MKKNALIKMVKNFFVYEVLQWKNIGDSQFDEEKAMWEKLFTKYYDGLLDRSLSKLDAEHYTDAFLVVCDKRYENVREITEKNEDAYRWLLASILGATHELRKEDFHLVAKAVHNKEKMKRRVLVFPKYNVDEEEYQLLPKVGCSLKGAMLVEEKIGTMPEFDTLFGRERPPAEVNAPDV